MMFTIIDRKNGLVAGDFDMRRSQKKPGNSAAFEGEAVIWEGEPPGEPHNDVCDY
jgi:hypothetical protein